MPPNLPIQPPDIFSDVDPLKKTVTSASNSSQASSVTPLRGSSPAGGEMPSGGSRGGSTMPAMIGVIVVGVVLIAGVVYMLFFRGASEQPDDSLLPQQQAPIEQAQPEQQAPIEIPTNIPLDSDGDGLTNDAEVSQYGTDPQLADSDADGLSDREEIIIYATDPRKVDTDGDTFSDGSEVKNGYNPKGEGRLFDIPR